MSWKVEIKERVKVDLEWIGKTRGREIIEKAVRRLKENPLAETRNMKTLRPNSFAQRELRVFGKYRVLFDVDWVAMLATILLVGEKRGELLIARGEEFKEHENHPAD